MLPGVIEDHSETTVDVPGMVHRILKHLPPGAINGLLEVIILDKNYKRSAFGCYRKSAGRIETYLDGIPLWQPWLLKKTYIFPYLTLGMVLGHEIDPHVNRGIAEVEKEDAAERNWFLYVDPSLGRFKPFVKVFGWAVPVFRKTKAGPVGN
jgi:hypothetical protein